MMADGHRGWPLPRRKWMMRMNWHELLFMHWPVSVESIARLIPSELEVDTLHGQAWIGLVPFHMTGVAPRGLPNIPGMSEFPELNVRTYVTHRGERPGVWFFSLDATQWLAVRAARTFFHLPYMDAQISLQRDGQSIAYHSERTHPDEPKAELDITFAPQGDAFEAEPGSPEHWFTARYCMYSASSSQVYRGEILHPPWQLQSAQCEIRRNTMVDWLDITLPDVPPLLLYSQRTDAVAWSNDRI